MYGVCKWVWVSVCLVYVWFVCVLCVCGVLVCLVYVVCMCVCGVSVCV